MPKSAEYWKKRFELLEEAQNRDGVQCYAELEKQYRQAQKALEGQILAWYQRFADNNGVTLADARKMLTDKELAELKWDVQQYIRYGEENALAGTWVKELENASAKFHISRLEALKIQTQQQIEVLFGNQLDTIDNAMRNIYKSGYYRTAFEIQKGVGVGWDFATLDDKTIDKVIRKPWAVDGKNFSQRVWGNREKLVNELNTTLTQNIILGKDPQKAIDEIARKMNTSKTAAGRLVMTEEAFFSSAAQKDCFSELDVEQYEILATLDSHTSDICQEMDGKHFKMSEWEVGATAPPFHVWCRTTTVPYFGDEFDLIGERAARGEDGKTYHVPGNMTYKEWEKSFVDGDKSNVEEVEYMSNSFKPQYGDETVTKLDDMTFTIKPVENSDFPLFVDSEFTKRTKAVRLTEKNLSAIKESLPEGFTIPRTVVIDFDKHGLNPNAIGGYHAGTNTMYINGRYDTPKKILDYVNKEPGMFANTTVYAPYFHELGHKYYEDSINLLVKNEKLTYNKAKAILEDKISTYIHENQIGDTISTVISGYAMNGYDKHLYSEIVAECFSAVGNETANEIIKLLR